MYICVYICVYIFIYLDIYIYMYIYGRAGWSYLHDGERAGGRRHIGGHDRASLARQHRAPVLHPLSQRVVGALRRNRET